MERRYDSHPSEDRAATAGVGDLRVGDANKGGNAEGSLVDPSGAIAEGRGKRLREPATAIQRMMQRRLLRLNRRKAPDLWARSGHTAGRLLRRELHIEHGVGICYALRCIRAGKRGRAQHVPSEGSAKSVWVGLGQIGDARWAE